jgi:hypothetical protein
VGIFSAKIWDELWCPRRLREVKDMKDVKGKIIMGKFMISPSWSLCICSWFRVQAQSGNKPNFNLNPHMIPLKKSKTNMNWKESESFFCQWSKMRQFVEFSPVDLPIGLNIFLHFCDVPWERTHDIELRGMTTTGHCAVCIMWLDRLPPVNAFLKRLAAE